MMSSQNSWSPRSSSSFLPAESSSGISQPNPQYSLALPHLITPLTPSASISDSILDESNSMLPQPRGPLTPAPSPGPSSRPLWAEGGGTQSQNSGLGNIDRSQGGSLESGMRNLWGHGGRGSSGIGKSIPPQYVNESELIMSSLMVNHFLYTYSLLSPREKSTLSPRRTSHGAQQVSSSG
jgi:hypothetical protein